MHTENKGNPRYRVQQAPPCSRLLRLVHGRSRCRGCGEQAQHGHFAAAVATNQREKESKIGQNYADPEVYELNATVAR